MAPTVLISLTCFLGFIFRWYYNLTKSNWLLGAKLGVVVLLRFFTSRGRKHKNLTRTKDVL